ncbi:tetratricopeptide repeat protein [Marinoscillum furvescens]|uniref:TPR repeat protein n=1 Tax=Marinoscillum furvescens DSM 4134 TaxID=1122208 RepID=A0A3D9KXR7_MARFU|nr:tetratricopeptide repeat protein [Marinoscillum furvescens]RED93898.1 TPR repeat protein [Marinoscillum furvescens DSM 4134]
MARIVKLPVSPPKKLGPKKAKRRRKPNLEDYGQLNLFAQPPKEGKVVSMHQQESFFEQALQLDDEGKPEAEKYYLLAIENKQREVDAYCNLGIIKSQQEDLAESINYLTKALELNPRHFEAHYNLANVYSDMGNFPLAKTHYEVSISIDPDFPDSYYNLGLVLISLKQYERAIKAINTYIEHSPESDHSVASELLKTLKSFAL